MVARATHAEIDAVRMSVGDAILLFEESVLPALHEQEGYEGAYVLLSGEGKALVLTFWSDEEAADAGIATGFYGEQVQKFVTIYAAQPGRELYDVVVAEPPAVAIG
jgi:heme-degrading monooxygenase HmoA